MQNWLFIDLKRMLLTCNVNLRKADFCAFVSPHNLILSFTFGWPDTSKVVPNNLCNRPNQRIFLLYHYKMYEIYLTYIDTQFLEISNGIFSWSYL